ncbi:MAG TPA: hypothetical protein DDW98_08900 [Gammaproteobacteria bacterium]|jgi:hypothetical protein|nr:hypothetical protein [Gammaproteobacteria bacterium]
MVTSVWVMIGIAAVTITNSWCQFFVKEVLLAKSHSGSDSIAKVFTSRSFLSLIAATGVTSGASIWALVVQVLSAEPLTRTACFLIAALTLAAVLNMFLIQSLFTLRRLFILSRKIDQVDSNALLYALTLGRTD